MTRIQKRVKRAQLKREIIENLPLFVFGGLFLVVTGLIRIVIHTGV